MLTNWFLRVYADESSAAVRAFESFEGELCCVQARSQEVRNDVRQVCLVRS